MIPHERNHTCRRRLSTPTRADSTISVQQKVSSPRQHPSQKPTTQPCTPRRLSTLRIQSAPPSLNNKPSTRSKKACPTHPTTPIHLFTDIAIGRKDGWISLYGAGNGRLSIAWDNPQQAALAEPRYVRYVDYQLMMERRRGTRARRVFMRGGGAR